MMKKFIKIMPRMVIENIDFNKLSIDDLESLLIISITTPGDSLASFKNLDGVPVLRLQAWTTLKRRTI